MIEGCNCKEKDYDVWVYGNHFCVEGARIDPTKIKIDGKTGRFWIE